MYVVAGMVGGAGLWYWSDTVRAGARQAGVLAAWYSIRVCTEIEARTEAVATTVWSWMGRGTDTPGPAEVEMVPTCTGDARMFSRRWPTDHGTVHVVVGRSLDEVAKRRLPCRAGIYAPVIRLREADNRVRTFSVEFGKEEYCLVGNVLFDPLFVAHWLYSHHGLILEDTDTWETSLVGPDMQPITITHLQKGLCTEDELQVLDIPRSGEEPAGNGAAGTPASEAWLLDLGGGPSP
jgi:hypothetical protein